MYLYIAAWVAWFIFSLVRQGAHRYMAEVERVTGKKVQISWFGLLVELYVIIGLPVLVIIGAIELFTAFVNIFI